MHDAIQQGVQALADQNALTREGAIVCAVVVVYLLGLVWLVVVAWQRTTLTVATAARIVALGVLAYLVSKVLTHVIVDPRPYIVTHTRPLIPVGHDNGFPSDHVLLAAALTASLWWIDRRWLGTFAAGTTLVLLGRLGVGAHHTIDVLGSVAIAAGVALIIAVAPLRPAWNAPLLPARWRTRAPLLSRPGRGPLQRP